MLLVVYSAPLVTKTATSPIKMDWPKMGPIGMVSREIIFHSLVLVVVVAD